MRNVAALTEIKFNFKCIFTILHFFQRMCQKKKQKCLGAKRDYGSFYLALQQGEIKYFPNTFFGDKAQVIAFEKSAEAKDTTTKFAKRNERKKC